MQIEDFIRLYEYNAWAHQRVWDCVCELSEADYRQPWDYSVGSVHEQCVHTLGAEQLWLRRLQGQDATWPPDPMTDASRDAVWEKWLAVQSGWRALLADMSDADLKREMTHTRISGATEGVVISLVLQHVVNHATDHRAQILARIHQLGGRTTDQDIIAYHRDTDWLSG